MALRTTVMLAAVVLAGAAAGLAQDTPERPLFAVAPTGDDAGPGTPDRPWRTIGKAASTAPPGAIVDVQGGTYGERVVVSVSGEPGRPITFRARPGETVTISGAGMTGLTGQSGLIHVDGRSHLEFERFVVRDLVAPRAQFVPAGVWIEGAAQDITVRGLEVRGIRTRGRDGNAHGIAVYGNSATPARDIAIEGNSVHDLRLGSSEAIVVNGNVDGWRVTGNRVANVDNIAIDAIGFERTAPRDDRARNGLIAGNVITDVDTRRNAAYLEDGVNCRCAGGIYVDGGRQIVIEHNRVTRANLGIELASEHRRGATSDVLVRNNLVVRSHNAGLTVGGYDRRRGRTERVQVVNNTFLDNDVLRRGTGELVVNFRLSNSIFLNNVFRARRRGLMVTNQFRENRGNVFDGNVWFTLGRPATRAEWEWRTRGATGFGAWRRATGGDAAGRYADPQVDLLGAPQPGSPVVDAGVATELAGATDLAGNPRVQGASIDAGAVETAAPASR